MAIGKDKTTISISIDKDVKILLEEYSQEIDLTLSKFARNLIYIALDDIKLYQKSGITKLIIPFRNLIDTIPGHNKKAKAGTAKNKKNLVTISVVIDTEVKTFLEEIANEIGLTLKTFARNLIYVSLDKYKLLKKVGLIRLAVSFKKFLESFEDYDPKRNDLVVSN